MSGIYGGDLEDKIRANECDEHTDGLDDLHRFCCGCNNTFHESELEDGFCLDCLDCLVEMEDL